MMARKFNKTGGSWVEAEDSPITDDMKAGNYVFYANLSGMNRARIKDGAVALKTRLGFWVKVEDHIS